MTALAEQVTLLTILVEDARTKPTEELTGIYRQGLDLAGGNPAMVPWHDAMDAVRIVLRERIASGWLHERWCFLPEQCTLTGSHLTRHDEQARAIAAAYVSGGSLADAVYRGLWPDNPQVSASGAADVATCAAFGDLIRRLVSVVPAEAEVTA